MNRWEGIVLHHTASPDRGTLDWPGIVRYHTEVRGWRDVGYNFGVETVKGDVVKLVGRPLTMSGAHEPRANRTHIGIALVGNYSEDDPTVELLGEVVRSIIAPMFYLQDIDPDADKAITFHRDWKPTECPGTNFTDWHKTFLRKAVKGFLEKL